MKPLLRVLVGAGVLAAGTSFVASAQSVISAKSGLVHYVEGQVYVNDQLVESKFGNFPDVKENWQLRTEEGEAVAERDGKTVEVKGGHILAFDGDLTLAKFDAKDLDQLYRWSVRRSEYLAMANVSAAKSVRDSGMYWGSNRWYWNPYFNMYTFVPSSGMYFSPFGFAFWSPFTVYNYLYSPVIYGGRGGCGGLRGGGPANTTTRVPRTSA